MGAPTGWKTNRSKTIFASALKAYVCYPSVHSQLNNDIAFSDPLLDSIQHITRFAAMSNFQSIPTDCPQRYSCDFFFCLCGAVKCRGESTSSSPFSDLLSERRGWLGDAQLSAESNIHNFFMAPAYTSFIQQIQDAQVAKNLSNDSLLSLVST